ncbi:hypothetical protein K9M79_03860 [Candidatus Woesearchaeota archaeon]|nr:hypothetical protein [Candidatus Woesearchaeota archaeon]
MGFLDKFKKKKESQPLEIPKPSVTPQMTQQNDPFSSIPGMPDQAGMNTQLNPPQQNQTQGSIPPPFPNQPSGAQTNFNSVSEPQTNFNSGVSPGMPEMDLPDISTEIGAVQPDQQDNSQPVEEETEETEDLEPDSSEEQDEEEQKDEPIPFDEFEKEQEEPDEESDEEDTDSESDMSDVISQEKKFSAQRDELLLPRNLDTVKGPVFVDSHIYKNVISQVSLTKNRISSTKEIFQHLDENKVDTDLQINKWKEALVDLQKKLVFCDKVLFEN